MSPRRYLGLLALPLVLAATIGSARASSIRDEAGMFDPAAVSRAQAVLDRIEGQTQLTTTIETVNSLDGENVDAMTLEHAKRSGTHGVYVLIAKQDTKIDVRASKQFAQALPTARTRAIRDAFIAGFKTRDFDGGLMNGVNALDREVKEALAENGGVLRRADAPVAGPIGRRGIPGRPMPRGGGFGIGSLLTIGLVILAVLIGIRMLGALFGGNRGGYPGVGPGGPGYGRPGYGSPGYGGGGGGGFMSSMFGGIGGALAGNWLYDQFRGGHHGGNIDSSTYGDAGQAPATGGDDWSGGTGSTGDWGGGGGDAGGDWGGGGGGGDWGGGGGDGGGGGGGDW